MVGQFRVSLDIGEAGITEHPAVETNQGDTHQDDHAACGTDGHSASTITRIRPETRHGSLPSVKCQESAKSPRETENHRNKMKAVERQKPRSPDSRWIVPPGWGNRPLVRSQAKHPSIAGTIAARSYSARDCGSRAPGHGRVLATTSRPHGDEKQREPMRNDESGKAHVSKHLAVIAR